MKKGISLIDEKPIDNGLNRLKAVCLLHTGDYNQSLNLLRKIYQNNPDNQNALLNMAEALSMTGYHKKADFFYNFYIINHGIEPRVYLGMSKNAYLNGDHKKASKLLSTFFRLTGAENVGNEFQKLSTDILFPLIGIEKMNSFIENEFELYKSNIKFSTNLHE